MKRWRVFAVILCALWGILMVLPTFLTPSTRARLYSWMPERVMTLGLDLRGGVHLSLEVDTNQYLKEVNTRIAGLLRQTLLKEKILYKNLIASENGASVVLKNPNDLDRLKAVASRIEDLVLKFDLTKDGQCLVQMPEWDQKVMVQDILNRSIAIVRKRVDATGALEPVIYAQGDNRIILQIPGFDDPARVRALLGKTAKLSFHWVGSAETLGCINLPYQNYPESKIPIEKIAIMSGEDVLRSKGDYQVDQYGAEKPLVFLEFTPKGRSIFADLTRPENHQRALAIVLDGEILSTPTIREHITSGSATISGSQSLEDAQKFATMINSGALPAPLTILEEKIIGPGLGADSIVAGTKGTVMAVVAVAIWMVLIYAYFGVFAVLGITFNLLFLVAFLILLGATLTLPGLAGIALTVGMSVDANVLINERIKEEWRQGKTVEQSINQGYSRAMRSILDSNVTTLTGALLLYFHGSGPVRGFAVTMGLGILISLFTAIGLTRMMVAEWLRWKKPRRLSI
jgi:preprotein translocase subunit SecD